MLVSNWRSVVIGLWATRILNGCRMREMFSDMPFMYGIVTVVVGVAPLVKKINVACEVKFKLRFAIKKQQRQELGHQAYKRIEARYL